MRGLDRLQTFPFVRPGDAEAAFHRRDAHILRNKLTKCNIVRIPTIRQSRHFSGTTVMNRPSRDAGRDSRLADIGDASLEGNLGRNTSGA